MSYFPVIFKIKHLIELRKYIETIHNKSFDEIIQQAMKRGTWSQFNIMCNYVWYFHNDEYSFYYKTNGFDEVPGIEDATIQDLSILPSEKKVQKAQITMHFKYQEKPIKKKHY